MCSKIGLHVDKFTVVNVIRIDSFRGEDKEKKKMINFHSNMA